MRLYEIFIGILAIILLLPIYGFSATIYVPGDSATIQAGIDGAVNGDMVLVADGTYTGDGNRDIDFLGKAIVVKSENGPENTIIDCEGSEAEPHRGFRFHNNEDSTSIIDGLTIINGYNDHGGAIECHYSSPRIINCSFRKNTATNVTYAGGAVSFYYSAAIISHCNIDSNSAVSGGGVYFWESDVKISFCIFTNNYCTAGGGGVHAHGGNPSINNCTFAFNSANFGGGIDYWTGTPNIEYCIVYSNSAPNGSGIWTSTHGGGIACSDIYNNINSGCSETDCIGLDPLFCDLDGNNYHLFDESPCAPGNNICGQLMGAFPVGCGVGINNITIEGEEISHVISHSPSIVWEYFDMGGNPQDSFEIEIGNDSDWAYAEMWNPAPFESPDTFVTYNGSTLIDGETYYLRLRVNNGYAWSEWYETSFRMNSVPSIPVPIHPILDEIVTVSQPTLYIQNSTDAEGDTLTYDFIVGPDSGAGFIAAFGENIAEQADSTGWTVDVPLTENEHYFWSVRAYDQYEYSEYSLPDSFWVNVVEEPPTPFQVQYPPDTSGWYVFDMLSNFFWEASGDNDPFDSVFYTLEIALDDVFLFTNTIDTIWEPWYTLTDSLAFGTQYWWKVRATDNTGLYIYSSNILDFKTWKLGDANGDWNVDIFDITFLISYLYKGGPAPSRLFMGDVNGDCLVNIFDVTYLITYLYKDGPAPQVGCE